MTADINLLVIALEAALPLWCADLRDRTPQELLELTHAAADSIAEHGDILMFRSGRRGETAAAFNTFAKALAAAVLIDPPGGVVVFGMHWRERNSRPCTGRGQFDLACPECAAELARAVARQVAAS